MGSPNQSGSFDCTNDQDVDFLGTCSTSGTGSSLFQDGLPFPFLEQGVITPYLSSSTSTKSTGSHQISYTPCDGSVLSFSPRASAPPEAGYALFSASSPNDPILKHFAQCMPSGSPQGSSTRQIADSESTSSSAEGTRPEETDSQSTELDFDRRLTVGTPATSNAGEDADILGVDQDHHSHTTWVADRNRLLFGLDLPG
jgi:hypothetical protein